MGMLDDLVAKFYGNPYTQGKPLPQQSPAAQPQTDQPQTLGGLAGGAQRDGMLRDLYLKHVMAAQEAGQMPLPYDKWLAAIQAQQAQQQQK